MNYFNIYNNIIKRSKDRNIIPDENYENHHIIPKCVGGTDELENISLLTCREHYIAHQLLCKMYPDNTKLILAVMMMTVDTVYRNSRNKNRSYEWIRKKFSKNHPSRTVEGKNKIQVGLGLYFSSNAWLKRRDEIYNNARELRICACGCGEEFFILKTTTKRYINRSHACRHINNTLSEDKKRIKSKKQSEKMSIQISLLTDEEKKNRLKNSLGSADPIIRGNKISAAKMGKSTNQQMIVGKKYAAMSDDEFINFLKTKSPRIITRLEKLRKKWKNLQSSCEN